MAFAIRRPPPFMAIISIHFLPHLFSIAIESYIYTKRILHLVSVKDITNKSLISPLKSLISPLIIGSNIDILRLLQPLTANYKYIQPYSWSPQLLYMYII